MLLESNFEPTVQADLVEQLGIDLSRVRWPELRSDSLIVHIDSQRVHAGHNALAAEAQLTAEATDYEGLSVVIIRLPVHVNQAEFNGILNRAEKLVHDADKERHKTSYPEAHADALMVRWQEDREEERLRRAER